MNKFRKSIAVLSLLAFIAAIPYPAQALDDRRLAESKLTYASDDCQAAISQPILARCNPAEYLVEFRSQAAQLRANQHLRKRLTGVVESSFISAFELGPLELAELARSRDVASVTKNVSVFKSGTQSSPGWHLDRLDQLGPVLDGSYTYPDDSLGEGVRVYVLDTGVNTAHQEFTGRIVPGYSSIGSASDYEDCSGHGTHVAALAAGSTSGVAKKADIVPVRVLDCAGSGTLLSVLMGLQWIAQNTFIGQPAVVNMSLGGPDAPILDSAIGSLVSQGLAFVVAAGNTATDACNTSPAQANGVITVASSDQGDTFSSFSNWGQCVDVIAPGAQVRSAWIGGTSSYELRSGTSMASGLVAGLVANQMTLGHKAPAVLLQTLRDNALSNVISGAPVGTPNVFLTNGFTLSAGGTETTNTYDPVQLPADTSPISVAPITEPAPSNPGVTPAPVPSPPSVSLAGSVVTLSWEAAPDNVLVDHYLVRINSANTVIRDVEVAKDQLSLVLKDLAPGVVYSAQLAYSVSSIAGPYSAPGDPFSFQKLPESPQAGEFSAWTKLLANGTQVKFYAKYPQVGQKIQFMVQRPNGSYRELAWLRIDADDLTETGEYQGLTNGIYFVRTVNLVPGKNRLRILVDGKLLGSTRTYSLRS